VKLLQDAVAAAKQSDVAIVFVGELVGEGYDKLTLSLPADQDRLINAVADAIPRERVSGTGDQVDGISRRRLHRELRRECPGWLSLV
jgi:glycosyl hydrolase family 3